MRGVFDDKDFKESRPKRDPEITLGTGRLLLIFLVLVLVCGFCFWLGYETGSRGGQSKAAAVQLPAANAKSSMAGSNATGNGPQTKPSATAQSAARPAAQTVAGGAQQAGVGVVAPIAAPQASTQTALQSAASGPPQVRPVLPQLANAPQATLMVQIAAVSSEEDADVLVGALRKRGYAVSAQRDPTDNLIHVRIGPFSDRNEANRWRLKLLNDGYNAMIQP